MAARARSRTVLQIFTTPSHSRAFAAQMLTHRAYSVLNNDTGKLLNNIQLGKHLKYKETRNKYFSNEMGRLFREVGKGKNGNGKRVEGTNNFI